MIVAAAPETGDMTEARAASRHGDWPYDLTR
jgi:hypothetical protein